MRRLSMCVVAALIMLCGCQRDISGTYLASDKDAVFWLQIVRTPDDHLTGQMAFSALGTDGKVAQTSVPVTGAVHAENVTVSVSRFMGLQTATFGGTLDGNKLTLSSGEASPIVLKRSNITEYQKQLGELNGRSQAILAAKAAALTNEKAEQAQRAAAAQLVQHAFNIERAQQNSFHRLTSS